MKATRAAAGKGRPLKKTRAAARDPAVVEAKEARHVESPVGFLQRGLPDTAVAVPAEYREPDAFAEAALNDEWRRQQLRQNFLPKGGLALKAVYRRRVVCDEERRTLFAECSMHEPGWGQILRDATSGFRMVIFRRPNISAMCGYNLVPVYFEGWASPEKECGWVAREVWGEFPDFVPDEAVLAWKRRQELIKGLIEKFREGELIGEGLCEYPEASVTLVREVIRAAWWSRNEVEAAFDDNALFRSVRNEPEPVLLYSDIRVLPPEDGAAGHSDRPRSKTGRRSERPAIEKAWNDLSLDEQRALTELPNFRIWEELRKKRFGKEYEVRNWSDKTLERYLGPLIAAKRREID
ncbi:MAG: hypothetical protein IH905_05555 [Proteobacteria bacterium]|nr:hypothetical protein [Pseudomonadota bacterium]